MIPGDPVLPAGIHHHRRAQNISLQEDARILNGAVHMALRREVDHDVRMLLLEQLIHRLPVADVRLHKAEIRVVHDALQGAQVSGIGQLVQTDDPIIRILPQHVENKIASNKTGSAGD